MQGASTTSDGMGGITVGYLCHSQIVTHIPNVVFGAIRLGEYGQWADCELFF